MALWERGEALARRCEEQLAGARDRVKAVLEHADDPRPESPGGPFAGSGIFPGQRPRSGPGTVGGRGGRVAPRTPCSRGDHDPAVHTREQTAGPSRPRPTCEPVGGPDGPTSDRACAAWRTSSSSATAPCLVAVKEAVDALLPWYFQVPAGAWLSVPGLHVRLEGRATRCSISSGHRPATPSCSLGTSPRRSTSPRARSPRTRVSPASTTLDLLPWLRGRAASFQCPRARTQPRPSRRCTPGARGEVRLVAVTGASERGRRDRPNAEIARARPPARRPALLDAARLRPRAARSTWPGAGSGLPGALPPQLYAPFGAGLLVGRPDLALGREPLLAGGGAVRFVSVNSVLWAEPPARHKRASRNIIGAVALGIACRTLQGAGRRKSRRSTSSSVTRRSGRPRSPGSCRCGCGHRDSRVGVCPFTLEGLPYSQVAAALSAEHPVGCGTGASGPPLVARLLRVDGATLERVRWAMSERSERIGVSTPARSADRAQRGRALSRGAPPCSRVPCRASVGLGTTADDLDRFVDAVTELATDGPRWTYRSSADGTDCWPDPDPRPWPQLPVELA